MAKRDCEKARRMRDQDKEIWHVQRKAEKPDHPTVSEGEDPDLADLQWGLQVSLY